jgi:oligopeptide transport system substrate-binding protein
VPPSVGDAEIVPDPGNLVGSGGYTLERADADAFVLQANPHYWAGEPAIKTVRMLTTLNGANEVDAFVAGDVDVVQVFYLDAGWIRYNRQLGPNLRSDADLSVSYYGFDTRRPPFDDVRVRQAFAQAVDWRRLASLDEPGSSVAATGIVPAGIPGTPPGDFIPPYDPAAARSLLAQAGFASGADLGTISMVTNGPGYDSAVVDMLEKNLGVHVDLSVMAFGPYQQRLATDSPQIWTTSWVADFPGPNDFLGVLLGSGSTANQGGWSSAAFDDAIARATSANDAAAATAAYGDAMAIVRDEAPVIPVAYGTRYNLVRDGLQGATTTGTGFIRLAGLAWDASR